MPEMHQNIAVGTRLRAVACLITALLALALSACAFNNQPEVLVDDWQRLSIMGTPAGYIHTVSKLRDAARPVIVTHVFSHTRINRMGEALNIRMEVEYLEDAETGALMQVYSKTQMADIPTECRAIARGDKLHVQTTVAGRTSKKELPYDDELIGPQEIIRRTREQALKPGGHLDFKTFVPDMARIARSRLHIVGQERIRLGATEDEEADGEKLEAPAKEEETEPNRDEEGELLWHGTLTQDVLPMVTTRVWIDDNGEVAKSVMNVIGGIVVERTTQVRALQAVAPSQTADLFERFFVTVNREIPNPYETTEAVYRIEAPEAILNKLTLEDRRQTVLEREEGGVLLRVRALTDAEEPAEAAPDEKYLVATPYVQSDDDAIEKAASEAVEGVDGLEPRALKLREWVYKNVRLKDMSVGFASAKEVLLSRRGDCTEHAVLLAALLRAQGIPARVAVGLVYYQGKFGYHMWTEAFLNDWRALDAALNQETVDATHIKLLDSALEEGSANAAFVNLVGLIGKMEITIEEIN